MSEQNTKVNHYNYLLPTFFVLLNFLFAAIILNTENTKSNLSETSVAQNGAELKQNNLENTFREIAFDLMSITTFILISMVVVIIFYFALNKEHKFKKGARNSVLIGLLILLLDLIIYS